jgi:hypothetical protein
MSVAGLLTQRATIQRWARTVDDYGESTPTWANNSTDVPCLVQQKSGSIAMGSGGREYQFSAMAYFETSADIEPEAGSSGEGDRVVVGAATYQVRGVGDECGKNKMKTVWLEHT